MPLPPIIRQLSLPLSSQAVFESFTALHKWWPKEYTWSQSVLAAIGIEPNIGGFCYEKSQDGFKLDWGTITEWAPNKKIAFLWQISPERVPEPNPEKASLVQIEFIAKEKNTIVQLTHENFERHGEGAAAYQTALDSPYGWTYLFSCYEQSLNLSC